jgi:hypothetical protein
MLGQDNNRLRQGENFFGQQAMEGKKHHWEIVQTLQWSIPIWRNGCVMQTITINLGSVLSSKFKMRQFLNFQNPFPAKLNNNEIATLIKPFDFLSADCTEHCVQKYLKNPCESSRSAGFQSQTL